MIKELLQRLNQQDLHNIDTWLERVVIWSGAALVGLAVVFFAHSIQMMDNLAHVFESGWWALLITPLTGMLIIVIQTKWFKGSQGSGIPQTIAALQQNIDGRSLGGILSIRIAFAKLVLGSLAVGSGFSLGREGPSVQIGASIMYSLRKILPKQHKIELHHLIVAGGAAGIAAAFNTPLAGVVFAIEELSRKFEQKTNGVILTAIVLAGVVSISFQGNYLYFGHFSTSAIGANIIIPVLLCGVVCGIAGGLFSRALLLSTKQWPGRLGEFRSVHPFYFVGACGLVVAIIGILTNGISFGSGYEVTRIMLEDPNTASWYFAPAKFIVTIISYFSGLPGGIFAPCLSIGAGIGHDLLPLFNSHISEASIYALCMVAFLAAVTQAPITSFIIVMEMIDGHEMVLSLIAATLIASLVSRIFSPALYHTLAKQFELPQQS